MKAYSDEIHINVGSDSDLTVVDLASLVMNVVGYEGNLSGILPSRMARRAS